MADWEHIAAQIAAATGEPFTIEERHPVGGGSINSAWRICGNGSCWFVKLNRPELAEMFAAEAEGLAAIAETGTVRVPRPLAWGVAGEAFIVMEQLELGGRGGMERLGEQLAALHRTGRSDRFGWHRDNTIGSTEQPNEPDGDWLRFWRERRLGFQLDLAARNGFGGRLQRQGELLQERLDGFFTGYSPEPSLLHGDLWSGNYAIATDGEPVIFDPACYYGDREADIAMTELFGGFGPGFYTAYNKAWPLDAGYPVRKTLYNLYHILNHANLFGGGYASRAETMIDRLLAEVK